MAEAPIALRLTPEQAAALGLKEKKSRPSRTVKGPYRTRCHDCGDEFATMAAEDRHVAQTHHARYELELPERKP